MPMLRHLSNEIAGTFAIALALAPLSCKTANPAKSAATTNDPAPPAGPNPLCRDTLHAATDDAPVVVLYERNPWLTAFGSDFPTVALWADGSVVFTRENGQTIEAQQATIGADEAMRAAADVASRTRDVAPRSSVSGATDQPTVEIVVHDGPGWRVAEVYGLRRTGAPAAPAGFMTAYRELLALRPQNGIPFQPTDIEVLFWGFDYAHGDPLPWPNDVPAPPDDAVPAERAPGDPVSHSFVVSPTYLPALRHMVEVANAANPPRGVAFNGHKWAVEPLERYRGQETVHRVLHCARGEGP